LPDWGKKKKVYAVHLIPMGCDRRKKIKVRGVGGRGRPKEQRWGVFTYSGEGMLVISYFTKKASRVNLSSGSAKKRGKTRCKRKARKGSTSPIPFQKGNNTSGEAAFQKADQS